jgi:4-hydroxybenzoate polyprenyltransferase
LTVLILSTLAIFFSIQISQGFFVVVLCYYALQLSYSFVIKNISLLDILAISLGFIMRVVAGETATGFHISVWLLLAIISGSLFLTIGKRRSELTLLSGWQGAIPAKTRASLLHYSEKMLDVYLSMFANATWLTYAFYSFLQPAPKFRSTIGSIFDAYQLDKLTDRKWIMLTIPVTIYGVMRYLQLIYEKNVGESPEKILLSDRPLIITTLIFTLMIFFVIYIVGK